MERAVLHADLDAFFVSVERIVNPRLNGRPVLVGGRPEQRGVVAAASYEAREFGVHSAMPTARALRLCPDAVLISGHHHLYHRASKAVFAVLGNYTPVIEAVGLDEGYLDLSGTERLFGRALDLADRLRHEVKERTGLAITVGASRNRLVSKVASKMAKPSGLFEVLPGQESRFLAPLSVQALPGIGPVTGNRLLDLNIERLGSLARTESWFLRDVFGPSGPSMRRRAEGLDETPVLSKAALRLPKSIGHAETFAADTFDHRFLRAKLHELLEHAAVRLRKKGMLARQITVQVRYADFAEEQRSCTLRNRTDLDGEFLSEARTLLKNMAARRNPVRLLGVRLSDLRRGFAQGSLFEPQRREERAYIAALDAVRERYGRKMVRTGAAIRFCREHSKQE